MRFTWSLALLLACAGNGGGGNGGDADTDADADADGPSLVIDSPEDDAVLESLTAVELKVIAKDADGNEVDVEPEWSAPGFSASGNTTVSDLPAGTYDLTASATVDGEDLDATVSIEVTLPQHDVDYAGTLDMSVYIESESYTGGADCDPGTIDFTASPDGTFVGTGHCDLPISGYDFTVSGTIDGSEVSGELATENTPDDPLPFEGTRDGDGTIEGSYDKTWTNDAGNGSIRLYGTLTAAIVD